MMETKELSRRINQLGNVVEARSNLKAASLRLDMEEGYILSKIADIMLERYRLASLVHFCNTGKFLINEGE